MSKLPEVSIIVPFNKDRGWLNEAIESVHCQTYKGKIWLLRSDIINPDTYQTNNVSQNINAALPYCKGEYIKYLCDDDLLTSICIEESVKAMQEQGCDFLHGNALIMQHGTNTPYYPSIQIPTLENLIPQCYINGVTLFYKAEVLKSRPFDEKLTTGEEWDLNLDLLKRGYKGGYVNKFLAKYRRHDQQKSLGVGANQSERAKIHQSIRDRYK